MAIVFKSFDYRAYLTTKQETLVDGVWLRGCCHIYNAALQERFTAILWKRRGWRERGVSYEEQTKSLTEIREADRDIRAIPVEVCRSALRRAHETEQRMWAAWKAGRKFKPRFKGRDQYTSFDYPAPKRLLKHKPDARMAHVRLLGPGGWMKIRYHRPIEGEPRRVTVAKRGDEWHVIILCAVTVEDVVPPPIENIDPDRMVGIDVGIRTLAALSTGEAIENPRFAAQARKVVARRQRELARKKRGSNSRRRAKQALRRATMHVSEQRKQHNHRVAKNLVRRFDLIALEDLSVAKMAHGNLAAHIYDAAWSQLVGMIVSKAESAGKRVVMVDPHSTSQLCSGCGERVPKNLGQRWHRCVCGTSLCRDVNAARNVLARALNPPCAGGTSGPGAVEPATDRRSTRGRLRAVMAQS